jgi:magnesium transporter
MRNETHEISEETKAQLLRKLQEMVASRAAGEAAGVLAEECDEDVARTLEGVNPAHAVSILWELDAQVRARILVKAAPDWARQWVANHEYPEDALGRLMTPAFTEFSPAMTVAEATESLREIVRKALVSYAFVVDGEGRLLGVVVFRELLLAQPRQTLAEVMIREPFRLQATTPVADAMREVLKWHHPSYPVCDENGRLVGVVRGQTLFQQQAFELSAQPGATVGVQKEERLTTPWPRSLRFRHPWLQLNLVTGFLAAGVVGAFEGAIDRMLALAVFLPVVAGQSGNTGSQALAVTLRGMTLGEYQRGRARTLVVKEAWLGLVNGALVGAVASLGMLVYATSTNEASAWALALVVLATMTGACVASGVSGVVVPLALRRLGADPATASTIVLTTATDCVSMGMFLWLATLLVP